MAQGKLVGGAIAVIFVGIVETVAGAKIKGSYGEYHCHHKYDGFEGHGESLTRCPHYRSLVVGPTG